jgi:curli biogenesis system outer membrane secretion channel CsgG
MCANQPSELMAFQKYSGGKTMKFVARHVVAAALAVPLLQACGVSESSRALEPQKVNAAASPYVGVRVPVSIGKFENRSSFLRGIFTDGVDRLGNQSKTILISHLNQSNRFSVLDRENLTETREEARLRNQAQELKAADYVISGDVTEFGRKEVGDRQLFGILGRGKEQIAYAKVTINVINSKTSEVMYSTAGAGEYALSNREIVGFGSTASYDATLNGKVLDLAIREAVDRLATAVDAGVFRPQGSR